MTDHDERIARERVDRACDLIAAAYRLFPLDPKQTLAHVRTAIQDGANNMAADIEEAARNG